MSFAQGVSKLLHKNCQTPEQQAYNTQILLNTAYM